MCQQPHEIQHLATQYLAYWKLLQTDPGAKTSATKNPLNSEFRARVADLSPLPPGPPEPGTVTPIFSPRPDDEALTRYVTLLADADDLSCATFAFGISTPFKDALAKNDTTGPLCFLLLEKEDRPNSRSKTPVVRLNSHNNTYEAFGSELRTPLGKWVVEKDNLSLGLNKWVAFIHLKCLLSDPLGDQPTVVTGSANFSEASTVENDENMMIIRGDLRVADIYFTEFNRLWNHYYYRSVVERTHRKKDNEQSPGEGQFLDENSDWLNDYAPGSLRLKRATLYTDMHIPAN